MNSRFINWYTQALGAVLGIFACLYSYVNGYMFVYGNINSNFDSLSINGMISSYLLLPLCIITLFLGIIRSFILDKYIFNISLININKTIVIITAIIGILGSGIYFLIPALLISFNIYNILIKRNIESTKNTESDDNNSEEHTFLEGEFSTISSIEAVEGLNNLNYKEISTLEREIKSLESRRAMAIDLLEKKADLQFITEVTGLTLKEIQELKKTLSIN